MPRRLEHYPNAQYEQILALTAGGQRQKITLASPAEAVKFRNAYMSWRSVVLREHRAGRLDLPYGFDAVATQQDGSTIRFIMREQTPQFQALGRVVADLDEPAVFGPTVPYGLGVEGGKK